LFEEKKFSLGKGRKIVKGAGVIVRARGKIFSLGKGRKIVKGAGVIVRARGKKILPAGKGRGVIYFTSFPLGNPECSLFSFNIGV